MLLAELGGNDENMVGLFQRVFPRTEYICSQIVNCKNLVSFAFCASVCSIFDHVVMHRQRTYSAGSNCHTCTAIHF